MGRRVKRGKRCGMEFWFGNDVSASLCNDEDILRSRNVQLNVVKISCQII